MVLQQTMHAQGTDEEPALRISCSWRLSVGCGGISVELTNWDGTKKRMVGEYDKGKHTTIFSTINSPSIHILITRSFGITYLTVHTSLQRILRT